MKTETPATHFMTPSIAIDRLIYAKIMHWITKAPGECSGLGKVIRLKDGTFKVVEAMLFPQENSAGFTEMSGEAIAKAMYTLRNEPGTLSWWWHSHVNMDVFWSGTDVDTIKELSEAGGQGGWCVATVFNKKWEYKSAFAMAAFEDKVRIFLPDIKTNFYTGFTEDQMKAWDAEYEKNCKEKVYTHTHTTKDDEESWAEWTERMGYRAKPRVTIETETEDEEDTHRNGYRSSTRKTPWNDSPSVYEIDQGWVTRWSITQKETRRFPVMPDGRVMRHSFDVGQDIPVGYYKEENVHSLQPAGVPRSFESQEHPLVKHRAKNGDAKARLLERLKGKTMEEVSQMEEEDLFTQAETLLLYDIPEYIEHWNNVISAHIDTQTAGGIGSGVD
jgi:hypothetical protein